MWQSGGESGRLKIEEGSPAELVGPPHLKREEAECFLMIVDGDAFDPKTNAMSRKLKVDEEMLEKERLKATLVAVTNKLNLMHD